MQASKRLLDRQCGGQLSRWHTVWITRDGGTENVMTLRNKRKLCTGVAFAAVTIALGSAFAQQGPRGISSYAPVTIVEPFSAILERLSGQKPAVEQEHIAVLRC